MTCQALGLCQCESEPTGPDTQLVINLETLGRSNVTMPGDDVGMEVEAVTGVHTVTSRPLPNVGSTPMQLDSTADMAEESIMTSASVHDTGSQAHDPSGGSVQKTRRRRISSSVGIRLWVLRTDLEGGSL